MRLGRAQSFARLRELLTFATVGLIGTAAHYAILIMMVEGWGVDPVIGSLVGALVGALVNYFLNYSVTFKSTSAHRHGLPKFMLVAALGLALNTGIMALSYDALNLHYVVSQTIATVTVLLWNYFGSSFWAFRGSKASDSSAKY